MSDGVAVRLGRRGVLLGAGSLMLGGVARAEEALPGYVIEVGDLRAKVGAEAVWRARLVPRPGAQVMRGYNNRVGQLSSYDDGVRFAAKSFPGVEEDGALVFDIRLEATKPGTHAVNGVFRVGYIEKPDYMAMVSLPMIAQVIASE